MSQEETKGDEISNLLFVLTLVSLVAGLLVVAWIILARLRDVNADIGKEMLCGLMLMMVCTVMSISVYMQGLKTKAVILLGLIILIQGVMICGLAFFV